MKKCMTAAFKQGIKGIKIRVSGRLGGAEIARTEWYSEDSVPLHTLRANIDYGTAEARTTYGKIGVKAWVYNGEAQTLKKQARQAARYRNMSDLIRRAEAVSLHLAWNDATAHRDAAGTRLAEAETQVAEIAGRDDKRPARLDAHRLRRDGRGRMRHRHRRNGGNHRCIKRFVFYLP